MASAWILYLDILTGFWVKSGWDSGAECVVLLCVLTGSEVLARFWVGSGGRMCAFALHFGCFCDPGCVRGGILGSFLCGILCSILRELLDPG